MGLEHILSAIEQETDLQLDRIRADAAAEREAVLDAGKARARQAREEAAHGRDAALARERARVLAEAQTRADRLLREAREEVFADAVEGVRAALEAIRADASRYEAVLRALIDEAIAALPTAEACEVDPRDLVLAKRVVGDRLQVRKGTPGWGGVVVVDPQGRRVDNRLRTRLAVATAELRAIAGMSLAALWVS